MKSRKDRSVCHDTISAVSRAVVVVSVCCSQSVRGADTLSSGANGATAVWGTNSNWQDNSFPTASDDVIIDRSNGSTTTVLGANATQAANSLSFGSGSGTALGTFTLRANTSGTTGRALAITTGNITVHSSVTGAIKVGEIGFGTLSMQTVAAGYTFTNNNTTQSLTLTSNFTTTGKSVTFSDAGGGIILDVQLTTPTFASLGGGTSGTTVITNNGASGSKTLNLNAASGSTTYAGKITDGATAAIALTKSGAGEQILSGANTYTGLTTVSAGTLTISGTHSGVGATTLSGAAATLNLNNSGALSSGLLTLTSGTLDNTSGAAITNQANNPSVFIGAFTFGTAAINDSTHDLNLGSGAVTYSGSGTPGITFAGTGTTLTFGGVLTGVNTKPLAVNGAGNTVSFGSMLIGPAATATQTLNGSGNITIEGAVSNAGGVTTGSLTYSGTGTLTLKGASSYNGSTTISSGIVNIRNSTALGAADGTSGTRTFITSGATLQLQGGIAVGNEALSLVGAGAAGTSGALQNVSGTNTYGGVLTASGSTTIASDSGMLNLTGALGVGGSSPTLTFTGAGNGNVSSSISQVNGTVSKTGAGTWTLSGTNNYGAYTAIHAGTLQFAKTTSLYNGITSNWTAVRINVKSGATLALNVGGAGEFSDTDLNTLLGNISVATSAASGLQAGANVGFDTTNAGGSFTQGNVIADSTGANGGSIGVTKMGTGTLVLDKTNTYTGATLVHDGKLVVNGNISTSTLTTVSSGATLGGDGTVGAATIDGILAPGNSIGTITATGDVTWNDNDAWVFELGSAASTLALADSGSSTQDMLDITGVGSDFLKGSGSSFTFDFANTGAVGFYKLVDWAGTTGFVAGDFVASNLTSGLTGTFTVDSGTSALYLNVVPEPRAALLGGIGVLLLLRRRN